MTQYANLYRGALHATWLMASWSESIKRAMDRVHTTWAGIIKHLLDRTSPNIIFIWSGEVILGLGFASPNITLPDQINMILVSVLSNKCIIEMTLLKYLICKGCTFYLRLFRLAEKMFTMHTLHAFGWIFFYHLEGCDSINFIDKNSLTLYCLITWNENYALLVRHYCRECQSCSIITQTQPWIT